MQDECQFKKLIKKSEWTFGPSSKGKLRSPEYGAGKQGIPPSGERAIKRCPLCNKRLQVKARYCVGGEFVFWEIPEHKPRLTRKPGPKRQSQMTGRGK